MNQEDQSDSPVRPELSEQELKTITGGLPEVCDAIVELFDKVADRVVEEVTDLGDFVSGPTY